MGMLQLSDDHGGNRTFRLSSKVSPSCWIFALIPLALVAGVALQDVVLLPRGLGTTEMQETYNPQSTQSRITPLESSQAVASVREQKIWPNLLGSWFKAIVKEAVQEALADYVVSEIPRIGGHREENGVEGGDAILDKREDEGEEMPGEKARKERVRVGEEEEKKAGGAVKSLVDCAPRCSEFGTCNHELGRCDCPDGYMGDDCSVLGLDRCRIGLEPTVRLPCNLIAPCGCHADCRHKFGIETFNLCYNYSDEQWRANLGNTELALEELYKSPIVWMTLVEPDGQPGPVEPFLEPELPQDIKNIISPSHCAGFCSGRGHCRQFDPNNPTGACMCATAYWGGNGSCSAPGEEDQPHDQAWHCINYCSGHGTCLGGYCKCEPGYWGTDCSLYKGDDGRTRALARPPFRWSDAVPAPKQQPAPKASPKIYIYDLPPYMNVWTPSEGHPFDWYEPTVFIERLYASEHRTPDPAEADYFFVPVWPRWHGGGGWHLSNVLTYLRTTWPFWDRSNGRDHIIIFNSDWGACEAGFSGFRGPLFENATVLTTWGYTRNSFGGRDRPCFINGQDVAIPPLMAPQVFGYEAIDSPVIRMTLFGMDADREGAEALADSERRKLIERPHQGSAGQLALAAATSSLAVVDEDERSIAAYLAVLRKFAQGNGTTTSVLMDPALRRDKEKARAQPTNMASTSAIRPPERSRRAHRHLLQQDQQQGPELTAEKAENGTEIFPIDPNDPFENPPRRILFYFNGNPATDIPDIKHPEGPDYVDFRFSLGARQELYRHFENASVPGFRLIRTGGWVPGGFLEEMLRSRFCYAPAGFGWAMRTVQSVFRGCIPVIVQPNVTQPFQDELLDWRKFAVVLDMKDIPRLPEILLKYSTKEVAAMRRRMLKVWPYFVWASTKYTGMPADTPWDKLAMLLHKKDAFSGVMQVLAKRLRRQPKKN